MANIGLNNFRYSKLIEATDGTASYTGPKKPAKAISCEVEITSNSAVLYADDVLAESDTSFQSGTVKFGIDNDDPEIIADMLGHTVTDGEIKRSSNDIAPFIGFGRVITKRVNGKAKFKVEFLYKVKMSEPSQSNTTKGDSLEFGTTELNGSVHTLENGEWSVAKEFEARAEAITYLEGLLAGTEPVGE